MAFPLVTPDDLVSWLREWEPNVSLSLEGKKPSPRRADRIFVVKPDRLN